MRQQNIKKELKQEKRVQRRIATGAYRVYILPKSVQVNYLWGKNDVKR